MEKSKKQSKMLSLVLAGFMALSMTACGADTATEGGNNGGDYTGDSSNSQNSTTSGVTYDTYDSYWLNSHDYKTMPIGAFNGLPNSTSTSYNPGFPHEYTTVTFDTLQRLISDYNDANVNMLMGLYSVANADPYFDDTMMTYCDEYNISYFPRWWDSDKETMSSLTGNNAVWTTPDAEVIETLTYQETLNKFKEHISFGGMMIRDEPGAAVIKEQDPNTGEYVLRRAKEAFQTAMGDTDGKYLYHVNLVPNWIKGEGLYNFGATAEQAETDLDICNAYTYQNYLEDFISIYQPQMLCYDFYPMENYEPYVYDKYPRFMRDGYFENLSVAREQAQRAGIPLWVYIQTSAWQENQRTPTRGELLWNVNTSLAYGVKGIQYFCGVQPIDSSGSEYFLGGMFDTEGERTETYYFVRVANQQIAAIDHVLMCAKNEGIIVTGEMPGINDGSNAKMTMSTREVIDDYRELLYVDGDHVMVGCFDYNGKTALYVVNNNPWNGTTEEGCPVRLQFNQWVEGHYIKATVETMFEGGELELSLEAGEGVLVVLE